MKSLETEEAPCTPRNKKPDPWSGFKRKSSSEIKEIPIKKDSWKQKNAYALSVGLNWHVVEIITERDTGKMLIQVKRWTYTSQW